MKFLQWLGEHLDILQYELVEENVNEDSYSLKLYVNQDAAYKGIIKDVFPEATTIKRGYHRHDTYESHPVATKHGNKPEATTVIPMVTSTPPSMHSNNPDYVMDCDSSKCDNGKYLLANGRYNICFRCDGKGWINQNKHDRNILYDKTRKAYL